MTRPKNTPKQDIDKATKDNLESWVGKDLGTFVSDGLMIDGKPYPHPEELVQVDWKKAAEALTAPVPATPIQVLGRASVTPEERETDIQRFERVALHSGGRPQILEASDEHQDFVDQAFISVMSKYGVSTMLNKAYDLAEEMWTMREKRRLGLK